MKIAPFPNNEAERLKELQALSILDTSPEEAYDRLARLAAEICGVPIALISLVDKDRQWFKSSVGVDIRQAPRDTSFCSHAILSDDLLIVPDAVQDERFADNPMVRSGPKVAFYGGAPLVRGDGLRIGTLCVIDTVPRHLSDFQKRALATLAKQVEALLELRAAAEHLRRKEELLRRQRDQLIAVQRQKDELVALVVHDLKSPLTTVDLAGRLVSGGDSSPEELKDAAERLGQASQTMRRLVMNLLDLSRSEEGTLPLNRTRFKLRDLAESVRRGLEPRARGRSQTIRMAEGFYPGPIHADEDLIRRVLENLLDNDLKYGKTGGAVVLAAEARGGKLELRVSDDGPGIPEAYREKVFEKYARLESGPSAAAAQSRGLGLAFCRMAVQAHGGTIRVEGNQPAGTVFVVELPAL